MRTYLVTGAAGFIGAHVAKTLLERGDAVVGIDNLNDYYDPTLKHDRLKLLEAFPAFTFYTENIANIEALETIFSKHHFDAICHLAAQAGVRYSLENPLAYIEANVRGTTVIFELARKHGVRDITYASSSSVYGNSETAPFKESQPTDHPISLYAATKKSCEVIASTYHHLYDLQVTGLRFFTVYGPWGRPDMSPIKFAKLIWAGQPIEVYNFGKMQRDFTYIDDIVDGVVRSLDRPQADAIINLGGSSVTELETFITLLEQALGKPAIKEYKPLQPGDVLLTSADTTLAQHLLDWHPQTSLPEGIQKFAAWFKEYYG